MTVTLERDRPTAGGRGRFLPSLTRGRLAVLAVVLAFLGGAVGYGLGGSNEPGSNSADVRFLQDMIVHHEQAVAMSYPAVTNASDEEVRGYAKDILTAQQYEIGLMDGWLRRWGQPREGTSRFAMEWAGHRHPKQLMPGMATPEQMERQAEATGVDAEDQFLALMIPHHRGGVDMAQAALERADDAEVRRLADLIVKAQESEIGEMQGTRQRLGLPLVPDTPGDHH